MNFTLYLSVSLQGFNYSIMHKIKQLVIFLVFLNFSFVQAQSEVTIGDKMAPFTATDHEGNVWDLKENLSHSDYLIIYFYPAAMTGGCTKQACAFRDSKQSMDSLNVSVVGVSGDKPAGLEAFRKMHQLNFTMLSDYDGAIAKQFGVPLRKGGTIEREVAGVKMVLERGVTTSRWTYVLDRSGRVVFKNNEVNVGTESKTLLSWLKANRLKK